MGQGATPSAGRLLSSGLVSRADALASVTDRLDTSGTGHGTRIIEVRLLGGLTFELLPDHGLDIGAAWFDGIPFAWRSPVLGDVRDTGTAQPGFLDRFHGGLLVTCGLDNIGPATATHEMHGSHHRKQATEVRWERMLVDDELTVRVSGLIDSIEIFGRRVTLRRTVTARTGSSAITIDDVIHNEGYSPAAIPCLYHVNFGAPFLEQGSRILVDAGTVTAREHVDEVPEHTTFPEPTTTMIEGVFEYGALASSEGTASAVVQSPWSNRVATVSWNVDALPRLFQWVWPTRGGWALGIEPANAPLFGPDRTGDSLGAPMLEPGASRAHSVRIELGFRTGA
nr:DUF4432 family protein [Lysinibacter cavernae]